MQALHTETIRGYRLDIFHDDEGGTSNPRDNDNPDMFVMRDRSNYEAPDGEMLPDDYPCRTCKGAGGLGPNDDQVIDCPNCDGEGTVNLNGAAQWIDVVEWAEREHGATVVMALSNPSDYGDRFHIISLTPGDSLDSLGAILIDDQARRDNCGTDDEHIVACMEGDLREYNDWAQGNVYGFKITDRNGDDVESCWGFIGDNPETGRTWALEEGRACVPDDETPELVTVRLTRDQWSLIIGDLDMHRRGDGPTADAVKALTALAVK